MNKFIALTIMLLVASGLSFLILKDSKPVLQKSYKIVAFGDSLTAGYGIDKGDSYPSVLQQRLQVINPNVTVINMGVSGETSAEGLKRIGDIIDQNPDVVFLGLGANDILRSLPVADARKNLEEIIKILQEKKITIVLLGMQTSLNSPAVYRKEFNAIYSNLAKKYDLKLVPFFLQGVALKGDLNISDRLHPNKAGYIKIVDENIMPVVKGMF